MDETNYYENEKITSEQSENLSSNNNEVEHEKTNKKSKKFLIWIIILILIILGVYFGYRYLGHKLVFDFLFESDEVIEKTDEQIQDEIERLFSESRRLAIFPSARQIDIKRGMINSGFAFGIQNLLVGPEAQNTNFSYEVKVEEESLIQCGLTEQEVESWILSGRIGSNIVINPGEPYINNVLIEIPERTSLCIIRLRVDVKANNEPYATSTMDIRIKE